MGGEGFLPPSSTEGFLHEPIDPSLSSSESSIHKLENVSLSNGDSGLDSGEFPCLGPYVSLISEAAEKQRAKDYANIMKSYEESLTGIERLEEAKKKILSYTPGSWDERAANMILSERDLPKATTLLLIGLNGKSSLVNKISRVLDEDVIVSERAQVSCHSGIGDGTYFLHEYTMPRGSGSFCLYDTRSLSDDSSENEKILDHWMENGVRHGELVKRRSDGRDLKARLKCKARRNHSSSKARMVNFVIFVINGLSVLESFDSTDEDKKEHLKLIAASFNNAKLSFKDDKPVVVLTHGDLLPLPARVKVRAHLGNLLGIPPASQIFDIPETNDLATTMTIYNMLIHCLHRADRHLPAKDLPVRKVSIAARVFLVVLVMAFLIGIDSNSRRHQPPTEPFPPIIQWHEIRHLWFE